MHKYTLPYTQGLEDTLGVLGSSDTIYLVPVIGSVTDPGLIKYVGQADQ